MPENIFTPYFAWENVDTFSFSALQCLNGEGCSEVLEEPWKTKRPGLGPASLT